jgi:hypothetical protein
VNVGCRRSVRTPVNENVITTIVERELLRSSYNTPRELGTCQPTVFEVLRDSQLHPYHYSKRQFTKPYVVSTLRLFLTQSSVENEAYFSNSHIWARDNPHRVNCSVSSCVVIVVDTVADLFLLKGCLIVDIVIFCKMFYRDCLKL